MSKTSYYKSPEYKQSMAALSMVSRLNRDAGEGNPYAYQLLTETPCNDGEFYSLLYKRLCDDANHSNDYTRQVLKEDVWKFIRD